MNLEGVRLPVGPQGGDNTLVVSRCCSSSDMIASSDPYLDIVQSRCEEALLPQGPRSQKPMPLLGGDAIAHRIQVFLLFLPVLFGARPCCALPCPPEVARVSGRASPFP